MEIKEKNYLFLILANVLSILFLLVIIASIWVESQPMAQGASMVLIAFSFPVLIGGSFLMMIIAKIRDEKPLWAYLSVIILPAIDVLIFAGAEKQDMMPAVLFLSIVTGAGAVSYGIGCFINRYFVKEKDSDQRLQNENYSTPNKPKNRFVIKSTKFISVINCFLTLILLNVEFGDVVISLLGILTIFSLILLLISKLKSEQPSFIDFLIANASLLTSLFASAYFSEWLMFWIIMLVFFIIEPVIWILFKYKIKIWLSIIILAITLTGVCYIIYSIIAYSENKSREQTEERYRKWDLEYLQNMKLEGNWVMILPAGYKINVPIKYLGDFKFKIEGKIFDAEYEKHFLKYFEDKHSSIGWQIVDKDSLLLRDYHCSGVVMIRGDKLLKMKEVPELNLSGNWVEISPGYFKKNSTIAYLGYLKYKIDGEIFDVDFTEGILTNYQDKKNPVEWKIVDNDSLQLINNKSEEAVLVRGDKIKKNIPKPTDPDLTGKWELVMPSGYKYDAEIEYLGKMMYSIRSLQDLGGSNYEITGNELKMLETQDKPWNHYIWKIENGNYLILTETPLEEAYRNDYCGAILKRKGSKSITTPPTEPNLSGRWNLITPKGYTYNVAVEILGNSLYRIAWNGEMGGVYEIGKKELKMYNPSGVSTRNYKWEITGNDSLTLTAFPEKTLKGNNYYKSVLIRSNKKSSSDLKKEPEIEGQWGLFIPPEYKYIIKIAKIGELRYRLSDNKGTVFVGDYEFIEDELVMIPQKGNPSWKTYTWKIENNKKLILLSSEYQGAFLSR